LDEIRVGEKVEVVVKTLCPMLATICTVAVSAGFSRHSEAQSKKVVVQLAWVVGGLHAEFFVGYMEEDRIVFQIKPVRSKEDQSAQGCVHQSIH